MSDEPQTTELPRTPAGIVEHWCQHPGCQRWGSFGYQRSKDVTAWFCGEHREEECRGESGSSVPG